MPRRVFLASVFPAWGVVAVACGGDPEQTAPSWSGAPAGGATADQGMPGYPTGTAASGQAADAGAEASGSSTRGAFACSGKTGKTDEESLTVKVGDLDRTMLVHVPPKYDPTLGARLVFNFHGFLMEGSAERDVTLMNATSDAHGFVVVYPDGVGESWNAGACCGQATSQNVDDIGFVKAAITKISSQWCIDPKRIYATGFSNGGFFTHRLACEMSDTIAAIAPVSGVMGSAPSTCKPTRPISVLDFHGTSDPVVPYNGGLPLSPIDFNGPIQFGSVADTVNFWRMQNDCLSGTQVYAKGDATCTRYACSAATNVEFCSIDGGGHTWPNGAAILSDGVGTISRDIDANEQIAAFFEAHELP